MPNYDNFLFCLLWHNPSTKYPAGIARAGREPPGSSRLATRGCQPKKKKKRKEKGSVLDLKWQAKSVKTFFHKAKINQKMKEKEKKIATKTMVMEVRKYLSKWRGQTQDFFNGC